MEWQIDFHKNAARFLESNKTSQDKIIEIVFQALKKFKGEDINIDIVKLKGCWFGFYRIRVGDIRVIAEFNFDAKKVYIENIDWRGRVYKK